MIEKSFSQIWRYTTPDTRRETGKAFPAPGNAGSELATGGKPMSLPKLRKYRIALAALLAAVALPAMAADLQMWERRGGNAKMADTHGGMGKEKNPDRKINLPANEHFGR